jgi:hypothetical protein
VFIGARVVPGAAGLGSDLGQAGFSREFRISVVSEFKEDVVVWNLFGHQRGPGAAGFRSVGFS